MYIYLFLILKNTMAINVCRNKKKKNVETYKMYIFTHIHIGTFMHIILFSLEVRG